MSASALLTASAALLPALTRLPPPPPVPSCQQPPAPSCARRRAASAGVAVARRSPVRDMPLCALFFALAQKLFCARANTRSVHIPHAASKPHRQPTSLRSWLVLLGPEAAYIGGDGGAVGDAALSRVDGHGAQAIHGGSKRKEEDQKDGSTASSTRAARRR